MSGVISNFSTWEMWRFLRFIHMWRNFRFLHTADVEKYEISPHVACVWCKNVNTYANFMLFCYKISFFAIYAILSRNLLCRDLRTFVWRKIYQKIELGKPLGTISAVHPSFQGASLSGEKWQISGLIPNSPLQCSKRLTI